jgi:hypothetical protein
MVMRRTVSLATLDALHARVVGSSGIGVERNERQGPVLDVIFVAMTLAFFAVCIGYVALCDRLLK